MEEFRPITTVEELRARLAESVSNADLMERRLYVASNHLLRAQTSATWRGRRDAAARFRTTTVDALALGWTIFFNGCATAEALQDWINGPMLLRYRFWLHWTLLTMFVTAFWLSLPRIKVLIC